MPPKKKVKGPDGQAFPVAGDDAPTDPLANLQGGADDEEPRKKRGPTMCSACKKRPEQTDWASRKPNSKVATGDKCMACFRVYEAGFLHLSWEDWCSRLHNPSQSQERHQLEEMGGEQIKWLDAPEASMFGVS